MNAHSSWSIDSSKSGSECDLHGSAVYPRGDLSCFHSPQEYCRPYSATEFYLCESNGSMVAYRIDPPVRFKLGKLVDLVPR